MNTRLVGSLVALLLLLQPAVVLGQTLKPADRGPWEITGFAGGFDDDPEFNPDGSAYFVDPDKNPLFGIGLSYHLPVGFSFGVDGRYAPLVMRPVAGGDTNLDAFLYSGLLAFTIPLHQRFDIYGVGGVSAAQWSPDGHDSELDVGFTYGGGARLYLTETFALTGHYRMTQVPKAMEDVSRSVASLPADETFWGHSFSGGVSIFLGKRDADGDGVKDREDECPGTPAGVRVDIRGCPVDSDRDGIPDHMDMCADTPDGARVNSQGCPVDSDGDGIFDGLDRCANTPSGARVNANGCPLDSDADGVFDGLDRCPGTPAGTEVDGVGCPLPEPEPEPEPEVFTFEGDVSFDFDSAVLTAAGRARLREIGDLLVTQEDLRVVVAGHTDSLGDAEYNMQLSRTRAEAVRDFLVTSYAQLSAEQFIVEAFGETRPVANNDTEAGRTQNRRVEIIVG
jgi:OOP family OmpA-OmpF porin